MRSFTGLASRQLEVKYFVLSEFLHVVYLPSSLVTNEAVPAKKENAILQEGRELRYKSEHTRCRLFRVHWYLHSTATSNFFLDDLIEESLGQCILENQCSFLDAHRDALNQVLIRLNAAIL